MMDVHRSGFYAWLKAPLSAKAKEDNRLLGLIRESYLESGGIYGSPRIHKDLREAGERCGENRVARLMKQHAIRALRGYKRPRQMGHKASVVAPNQLQQQFNVAAPDQAWVTDITYIRTYEGWLYLAVVIDLFSRRVVGWSMKPTLAKEVVIDALMMAVWRRKPNQRVIIHSDQGAQFSSDEWCRFLKEHNLAASMSRRGNCYDNAVAESFFSSLKKEKVKRRIYPSREEARTELFEYIEVFYNRRRRHSYLGQVSPLDYEDEFRQNQKAEFL